VEPVFSAASRVDG